VIGAAGAAGAGVVEGDVEAAEHGFGDRHGRGDVRLEGHIAALVDGPSREAGLQHGPLLVLHIGDDDKGALGDEPLHRRQADAGASAGDQRDLAVQSSSHLDLPVRVCRGQSCRTR
jgi:hypothetical protein